MADTYTTNLNLTKPEPGAAEDTWGISLNADLDSLDAIFGSGGTAVSMGAVTLDGLTVDGVGSLDNNGLNLELSSSNTGIIYDAQNGYHTFKRNGTNALQINGGTGDVYFYDDTGSTQGLFWDASAEKLGIGTTSPNAPLQVESSIDYVANFKSTDTTAGILLTDSNAQSRVTNTNGHLILSADINNQVSNSAIRFMLDTSSNAGADAAMVLRSTGLGIGIPTPNSGSKLHIRGTDGASGASTNVAANEVFIENNGDVGITLGTPNTGTGYYAFADSDIALRAGIFYDHSTDDMGFRVASSTAMTIDSNRNVGIGTTSPSTALHVNSGTTDTVATFQSSDQFADIKLQDSGGSSFIRQSNGSLIFEADRDNAVSGTGLLFKIDGSNVARFDTSGNLLVAKTAANSATQGVEARVSGQLFATSNSAKAMFLNRLNSDGDIVDFRKDGTTVGNIKSRSGDLIIHTGITGLRFNDANDAIHPVIVNGSVSDGATDLGLSNARFKDLHLSGTANVGSVTSSGNIFMSANGSILRNSGGALQLQSDASVVILRSNNTTALTLDTSQNAIFAGKVGIGTTSPSKKVHIKNSINDDNNILLVEGSGTTTYGIYLKSSYAGQMGRVGALSQSDGGLDGASVAFEDFGRAIAFRTNEGSNNAERARFISGGAFLIGKTGLGVNTQGLQFNGGLLAVTKEFGEPLILNRKTTDGTILNFRKDNTTQGNIGTTGIANGVEIYIASGNSSSVGAGLSFANVTISNYIAPCRGDGSYADNLIDLGTSSARFDDIYATNGTIQTSDRNEKQDIQELSDAEQRVATACKGLIRRFRWQDAVEEKGDDARYHFGVIAQDLQDAFTAEGLDAGDYGMFISSTWTDDDGNEQTRLGVRYNELLAFIITTL